MRDRSRLLRGSSESSQGCSVVLRMGGRGQEIAGSLEMSYLEVERPSAEVLVKTGSSKSVTYSRPDLSAIRPAVVVAWSPTTCEESACLDLVFGVVCILHVNLRMRMGVEAIDGNVCRRLGSVCGGIRGASKAFLPPREIGKATR